MKKMTIDGNTAASHVAYAFSEVAAIYPILRRICRAVYYLSILLYYQYFVNNYIALRSAFMLQCLR